MATETVEQSAKAARDAAVVARQKELDAENAKRSGKGTRLVAGLTRGKNPQVIAWEEFDTNQPDTLPADFAEFMNLTADFGGNDEKVILPWLVDGFNAAQRTNASDPVSEYVNGAWSDDVKKAFRNAVKAYSAGLSMSIEDAAGIVRPVFDKQHGIL